MKVGEVTEQSRPDVFDRYGLRRIVNVSGTETPTGASPVAPEVIEAVSMILPQWVDMLELQSVACHTIARAFETEAGCVVHCTAAGISTAIAAIMAGQDLDRAERLPDTSGMKNEVIIQRGHNVNYGGQIAQNVRLTGAHLVEIGAVTECGVYHLEAAVNEATAAAIFVLSPHTVSHGLIELQAFIDTCKRHNIPVLVDAAAEPDPRLFIRMGADLTVVSMHKQFAGITAGLLAGRLDLIKACMFQEKGIARSMKVGKEAVMSSIAALERWEQIDRSTARQRNEQRLKALRDRLSAIGTVTLDIAPDPTSGLFSRLQLHVDAARAGIGAHDLAQKLRRLEPSIMVRSLYADTGVLQIDLQRVSDAVTDYVGTSIERLLREAAHAPAMNSAGSVPTNAADSVVTRLRSWPFDLLGRLPKTTTQNRS